MSYPTKLRVCVKGSDHSADGVLQMRLPCTPSLGLYLSDLCTQGLLYIDQPIMSAVTGEWEAWCSMITEDDMTCDEITECFVGPWEWTRVPHAKDDDDSGDDPGCDPVAPDPTSDDTHVRIPDREYDRALKALLRGRTIPENN